jgi:hypothetical protein
LLGLSNFEIRAKIVPSPADMLGARDSVISDVSILVLALFHDFRNRIGGKGVHNPLMDRFNDRFT